MTGFPTDSPAAVGLHAEWYAANAAAGAVTAQRCDCGAWRLPARYRCPSCHGDQWAFGPVDAAATVESWTITRRPLHFAYAECVPYGIVVARTAQGPRLLVHVRPSLGDGDVITVGDPLELAVDEYGLPYASLVTRSR